MYRLPFRLIALGFVIVLLDFRINGVDILLDPIGYILLAIGLAQVRSIAVEMTYAAQLAWVLVVVSAFTVVSVEPSPDGGMGAVLSVASIIEAGLSIFLTWFLFTGIMAGAQQIERADLVEVARFRRNVIVGISVAGAALLIPLTLVSGRTLRLEMTGELAPLILLLGLAWIVAFLWMVLGLLWRAGEEL